MINFRSILVLRRIVFFVALMILPIPVTANDALADEVWLPVPRPALAENKVTLRVAHAVNPRFSHMSNDQLAILLQEERRVAKAHFGIDIEFSPPEKIDISELFALRPDVADDEILKWVYDFKKGGGKREQLVADLLARLQLKDAQLEDIYAFARPHLLRPPRLETAEGYAETLTETLLRRLKVWRVLPAKDKRAVIDDSVFNDWTFWDTLAHGALPFDIVLTNQLVASAEYYGMDVHSALRGGITVGTTSFSRDGPFHTYAFLSTFPFANDYAPIIKLRGGARYGEEEAAPISRMSSAMFCCISATRSIRTPA